MQANIFLVIEIVLQHEPTQASLLHGATAFLAFERHFLEAL